jgi:hypothetical protein
VLDGTRCWRRRVCFPCHGASQATRAGGVPEQAAKPGLFGGRFHGDARHRAPVLAYPDGRERWHRYVIPGNEPLSVLIRLFLLSVSEPEPLVREALEEDDLELLRDFNRVP